MNLIDLFATTFRERRNEVALEWACQEYTFGDLDHAPIGWPPCWRRARCRPAIASLSILPNRLEYVDLFLAATRLGVIVVPINILYREREAGHILRDSAPRALVVSGRRAAGIRRADLAGRRADRGNARVSGTKRARRVAGCRHTGGADLHVGDHRRRQGRGAHARQLRRQRHDPGRGLAHHRRRPLAPRVAALPRARPRQRHPVLAAAAATCASLERFDHTPQPRRCSSSGRRCSSACRRCTCACSRSAAASARAPSARRMRLVRLRLGAAAARRCSRNFASASGT